MALSGGVDSAVAAARLVRGGRDVVAVHLRTGVSSEGEAAGGARSCCGADDARDAREVAGRLGVPFYVVDVEDAFRIVLDDFVAAHEAGRTPNPCVLCNRHVKFGRLLDIARELGAGQVATGHYARVSRGEGGRFQLRAAVDPRKDQSYVLHRLDQQQLAAALFPLGDTEKDDVREEARALGLGVADKPDSQELCFVPTGDHRAWLREHAPHTLVPGEVVDEESGEVLGRHEGAAGFTIGQRRGLPASGRARYVTQVDARSGRVSVGDRDAAEQDRIEAISANWIARPEPAVGARLAARFQVRHAGERVPGTLTVLPEQRVRVDLERPVFAPAPGQALVAYEDDAVLCGATITPRGSPRGDASPAARRGAAR